MLHGKQIHLVIHGCIQSGRIDLKRFIHKHRIVNTIRALVFRDAELILIFSEVQPADDPV